MTSKITYLSSLFLCLFIFYLLPQTAFSQNLHSLPLLSPNPSESMQPLPQDSDDTQGNTALHSDPLEKFAKNKVIPQELREVVLIALSFYPELQDTSIDFIFCPQIKGSVMQAQPKIKSMWFRNKRKRVYKVKISRHLNLLHQKMAIEKVPQDVLIGWIGHELGHIMDYRHRSNLAMACFGVNYVCSKRFLKKAERNADKYAIEHGLSEYIIKTKHFILDNARFPKAYKEKIRELYMSPKDVIATHQAIEKE